LLVVVVVAVVVVVVVFGGVVGVPFAEPSVAEGRC